MLEFYVDLVGAHFVGLQQSIAVPKGKDAGLAYLRRLVEDAKASGLVARAIEKTSVRGASVAFPAKYARLILPSP